MTIRMNRFPVQDKIWPEHVLVSVFDKTHLDFLVDGLIDFNPDIIFYSTGGTGKRIQEILGRDGEVNYRSVEEYTGAPEMEGGLVKTLHPMIHAGLLGERNNPAHQEYLVEEMWDSLGSEGVFFDVMVGNLYPFTKVVRAEDATAEKARINIDIGGPTMMMAGAKNFHGVAVLSNPGQYVDFVNDVHTRDGIRLKTRFALAQAAMRLVGEYRSRIAEHFDTLDFQKDVLPTIHVEK